jgi:hypothetical protein
VSGGAQAPPAWAALVGALGSARTDLRHTMAAPTPAEAGGALDAHGSERPDQQRGAHATGRREERAMQARRV